MPRISRATPSAVLRTTLPVNPSVTSTSATPAPMSRPSTLPTKRTQRDSLIRWCASLARSLPLPGSSPTLIRPTRASPSRSKYRCANTPPRIAKFSRSCGRHITVAPASSRRTGELRGRTVAMAGRRQPSRRPIRSNAAATVAPVLPAEKKAPASPSRTISAATATLASGRALSADAASSPIPTGPPASRKERFCGAEAPTSGRTSSLSPTRKISSCPNLSAAATAPVTTSRGALSPPRASTAMRIGAVGRLSAGYSVASTAMTVRPVRLAAVRAGHEVRLPHRLVRPALVRACVRRLLLRYRHAITSCFALVLDIRGEEPAEAPPPWVDLIFHSRGFHRFRPGAEHLHRNLARQGVPGVTRQVQRPILDREFAVLRARQKLRLAELKVQLGGLERPVA